MIFDWYIYKMIENTDIMRVTAACVITEHYKHVTIVDVVHQTRHQLEYVRSQVTIYIDISSHVNTNTTS